MNNSAPTRSVITSASKAASILYRPNVELRYIIVDGEPWFIAADACRAIGYRNPTLAVRHVDTRNKAMYDIGLPGSVPWFINEAGLLRLTARCKKPGAAEFAQWLHKLALPTIDAETEKHCNRQRDTRKQAYDDAYAKATDAATELLACNARLAAALKALGPSSHLRD